MSRISRYQDSISKFIKSKSCYSQLIKDNKYIESILNLNNHISSIILLTILNNQYKKRKIKTSHGYYMAAGINLMMMMVYVGDNLKYFESLYGELNIRNFMIESPIHILGCLVQNIELLENIFDIQNVLKIEKKVTNYIYKKLLCLTKVEKFESERYTNKCDVMGYRFTNNISIENKYRKIKRLDKNNLIDYVMNKYGSVCQCAFVIGWLFGSGDDKMIDKYEKIGNHLAMIIKLAIDFENLERDIVNCNEYSLNLIINLGVYECFTLFDENKIKLLEYCFTLDIYTITIKEVIDYVERLFDQQLQNVDLDLKSQYSDMIGK
jgi:hypothetical protein